MTDINTENLREMEGFVTQETHLFHDSIKNNLRIAKLDATGRRDRGRLQKGIGARFHYDAAAGL